MKRRRMLRAEFYRALGRLAQMEPARAGAILAILEAQMDDGDAVDAALRLMAWAGAPDDDGGVGAARHHGQ